MGKKTSEQGRDEVQINLDESGEIGLAPENDATLIFAEQPESPQPQAAAGGNFPPKDPPKDVITGGNGDDDDNGKGDDEPASDGSTFGDRPFVMPEEVRADIQELALDGAEAGAVSEPAATMAFASQRAHGDSFLSNLLVGTAAAVVMFASIGSIAAMMIIKS